MGPIYILKNSDGSPAPTRNLIHSIMLKKPLTGLLKLIRLHIKISTCQQK